MEFHGYEFEEHYLPPNFEQNIRACVNFNVAFYLKKKYIQDENDWIFEDKKTDDGEDVVMYCPTLNSTEDIDKKIVEGVHSGCSHGMWNYTEPNCPNEDCCCCMCTLKNAAYKHSDLKINYRFGFVQQTNRGVVVRVFKCEFDFSGEKYELCREGNLITTEAMRVFFNTDRTTEIYSRINRGYSRYAGYFNFVGGEWKRKKKYQDVADYNLLGGYEGTLLEGFSKYFERAESIASDDAMRTVLLIAMFSVPVLKKLLKAGYLKAAEEVTYSFLDTKPSWLPVNKKAKSIKEFFKFDMSKLNRISEEERSLLSIHDLPGLRELNRLGLEFSEESITMATSDKFVDLLKTVGDAEIKTALKYLRTQNDINVRSRIGDYYDYLNQVKALKLNIGNKEIRYPKSLNNAHTRLSALLKFTESVELQEKYCKQAARYEKYCFRQHNLSLRAVRTVLELKIWAQRFSNCSGGYVDRIADGRAMIFVIVDRTNPKKPFYMLEYNPKTQKIVQCRSYHNLQDENDNPAVKDFCNKWLDFIKDKKPVKPKRKAA